MRHSSLNKIEKLLNKFFCYFKEDNILVVSEDKSVLPFAYLIIDPDYPKSVLLALAIDYANTINVAELIILANQVCKVLLSQSFYISALGNTYFDDDAYYQWDIDSIDLNSIVPLSNELH